MKLSATLLRPFGLDLRSLALFRVLLAAVLLADLCGRLADAGAFYTDAGVLPRAALAAQRWRIGLHLANGQAWFIYALLALEGLAAAALLLGWRTRLATALCFLLHASLLNRNELVLLPGDSLLACLLFWSLFLPLQARWSVDGTLARNPAPADQLHRSWAGAALLLQVAMVYLFGAALRGGADWWPQGSAPWFALQADGTALGRWLLSRPDLLHAPAKAAWPLLWLAPLLLFTPLRLAGLALLVLLQLGALLGLRLGLTPWVGLAALAVFVPGGVWDALDRRAQRREEARGGQPLRIYYDRDCGFCLKMCLLLRSFLVLPRAQIAPAQDHARAKALLEANYSWVIIDHDDRAYLKWPAFVVLLRRSPAFAWKGWLLSGRWAVLPGNAVYDFVGRHRGGFGKLSGALLPLREIRFETAHPLQLVAGAAFALVLAWNLCTVQWLPHGLQRLLAPPLKLLRLDQDWNLYAPAPPHESGWFVLPGEFADGAQRDLLRPEADGVRYERPQAEAERFGGRWRPYLRNLSANPAGGEAQDFARYLCHDWNAPHAPAQALRGFKLVQLLQRSEYPPWAAADSAMPQTPGVDPMAPEQHILARFDCAAH